MEENTTCTELEQLKMQEAEFLRNYDPDKYKKPSVTVDMLLFHVSQNQEISVLLVKRGNFPDKGKWAMPGGFVNMTESLEDAAKRELWEETCVKDVEMEQLHTFGAVDRDPRGRTISVTYMAVMPGKQLCAKAGDDAASACWFLVEQREEKIILRNQMEPVVISSDELAFDHDVILRMGLKKMQME